jgi:AcrR family transcriptional regulator
VRKNYHHGDLRSALLDATLSIVRKDGPNAVTLRDVAKRAGVSEAAPYHHFDNKSQLLLEAATAGYAALGARLGEAAQGTGSGRDRVIATGAAYVRFALDEPGYFRLLFGAHVVELVTHPAAAATKTAGRAAATHLRESVAAFLAESHTAISSLELERLVWSQIHGLAWLVLEQELRPEPSHDEAVALVAKGLGHLLDGLVSGVAVSRPQRRRRRASSQATRRTDA